MPGGAHIESGGGFQPFSRETLLLLNNIFLVVAAASVLLGTLYPLLMDALNLGRLSVGPPYFNSVFVPVMLPFLVLIGIGPYVRWKHGDPKTTLRTVKIAAIVALLAGVIAVIAAGAERGLLLTAGIMLAAWAGASAFVEPVSRLRQRLQGRHSALPRAVLGMSLAHLGAGCLVLGITVTSLLGVDQDQVIAPGGSATVAGYRFHFQGVTNVDGPNYQAEQGHFVVTQDGEPVATMLPEKRRFSTTETTEAAIHPGLMRDLLSRPGQSIEQRQLERAHRVQALVRFIWLGGIFMMLGGILAASDRRYRRRGTSSVLDASAAEPEAGEGTEATPRREA